MVESDTTTATSAVGVGIPQRKITNFQKTKCTYDRFGGDKESIDEIGLTQAGWYCFDNLDVNL